MNGRNINLDRLIENGCIYYIRGCVLSILKGMYLYRNNFAQSSNPYIDNFTEMLINYHIDNFNLGLKFVCYQSEIV